MLPVPLGTASDMSGPDLTGTYRAVVEAVTEAVSGREDADLERPTRCDFTVRELLWHETFDAVRALTAFASTTEEEPDVDAVSYWHGFTPDQGDGGAASAQVARVQAGAYPSGQGVVEFWTTTAPAAVRAAARADPGARVRTQGHVIAVPDFVSTLVVEATIHLLDLTVDLPHPVAPPAAALAETRRVLDLIARGRDGAPLPAEWSDTEAALRGTGRGPGVRPLLG